MAAVTPGVVDNRAWKNGRTYCNTICPVGTTLSFFSRFAMFRPVIDADKCKNCKMCEHNCKAACINIAEHKIDYSRCVDCFNCIEDCKFGALKYRFAWGKKVEEGTSSGAFARIGSRSDAEEDVPSSTFFPQAKRYFSAPNLQSSMQLKQSTQRE